MRTKTKMALAAALILGSTSMSFAQSGVQPHHATTHRAWQSREVALPRAPVTGAEEQWMDRASQSFDGGGY